MDRRELAGFLRSRRERITPADVGLPAGQRRRTPGLRREEVAQLAFISTEYYARLEQARAPHPSREVLAQLARALRLSDAERDHLHHLAGAPPGPPPGPSREIRQSIVDLLRRLPEAAALVVSATYEVIAWNDLAAALMEDFPSCRAGTGTSSDVPSSARTGTAGGCTASRTRTRSPGPRPSTCAPPRPATPTPRR